MFLRKRWCVWLQNHVFISSCCKWRDVLWNLLIIGKTFGNAIPNPSFVEYKRLCNGCKSASGTGTWRQKLKACSCMFEPLQDRACWDRAKPSGYSRSGRLLLLEPGTTYQNRSKCQESFTQSLHCREPLLPSYKNLQWYFCLPLSFMAPEVFVLMGKTWRLLF